MPRRKRPPRRHRQSLRPILQRQHPRRRIVGVMWIAEVGRAVHAERLHRQRTKSAATTCLQRLLRGVRVPHIGQALAALRVGIECRHEAAVRRLHGAHHEIGQLVRHLRKPRIAGRRLRVHAKQLPLVVQHLLEVRHGPRRIHGVAMKAAVELITHATKRHALQRSMHNASRRHIAFARLQKAQQRRLRKLGRTAKAPMHAIMKRNQRLRRRRFHRHIHRATHSRKFHLGLHQPRDLGRLRQHLRALIAPRQCQPLQQFGKRDAPHARLGRKVCARKERLQRHRIQEHMQRPPATRAPLGDRREHLTRRHPHRIQVRSRLAVHLHAHIVAIHHGGDARVLEAFVLHHMAPVAGAVADADEQRHIALPRLGDGRLAPRPPRHGVARVLTQIGAGLAREAVHTGHLATVGRIGAILVHACNPQDSRVPMMASCTRHRSPSGSCLRSPWRSAPRCGRSVRACHATR